MTQDERRSFLIEYLLNESDEYSGQDIPRDEDGKKFLLRALFNVRPPRTASEEFIRVQDEYLKEAVSEKGITDYKTLNAREDGIYLWQGDITTLKCGAVVNAANSAMLGCFAPNHYCIDNAIHTFAGIQLRLECDALMKKQAHAEETGSAKITAAYNLPCDFVLHTVGPIVGGGLLLPQHKAQLSSCYNSCLDLAAEKGIKSVAFCCISTGVFGFPQKEAAKIAVETVRRKKRGGSPIDVIFNVFKREDYEIYSRLL